MQRFKSNPLPGPAEQFLKEHSVRCRESTVAQLRSALHHFHRYLDQTKLDIGDLKEKHIHDLDEDLLRHSLKISTRSTIIKNIARYVFWLEKNEYLVKKVTPDAFPNRTYSESREKPKALPQRALDFLSLEETIFKKTTVRGHASTLRHFYKCFPNYFHGEKTFSRPDVEKFMKYLHELNIKPDTYASRLQTVRSYLFWLFEKGSVNKDPWEIIKRKDFPKIPKLVPKPFPSNVDVVIQKRLLAAGDPDSLAVLLLRKTGLRVGEMSALSYNCVTEDLNSNKYLNVPLGKLNTDRVVPISDEVADLVEKIKCFQTSSAKVENPLYLLSGRERDQKRKHVHFRLALNVALKGLAFEGKSNIHRLRHTFATTMLTAGMSLTSIKEYLGHKDIRMTLGYAAVTQEKVREEYFKALKKSSQAYNYQKSIFKASTAMRAIGDNFYKLKQLIDSNLLTDKDLDSVKIKRLLYRMNSIRHELYQHLKEHGKDVL